MNFIKKIFDDAIDESVHFQFMKFSRGGFKNKASVKVKKSGRKYSINTSAEFANELVRVMAKKLGERKTIITGAIVSTSDLKNRIDYKEIKQFQGVKRYLIDKEMSGTELITLLDEFRKTFFALTFDADEENKLKIKPKAPKSGKPKAAKEGEEEEVVADFCKLITNDEKIGKSFVFEKPDFKQAEFKHTFVIEDIVVSNELKKERDFALVREKAKRKGKIIREGEIDGQKIKEEKEFEA